MSSYLKQYKKTNRPLKIVGLNTPSFDDGTTYYPFPFSYNKRNSTLDIDIEVNDFKSLMIDTNNEPPTSSNTDYNCLVLGGNHLVQDIDDNFKDYIRSWRDSTIDVGSDIVLYQKPVITRVQILDYVYSSDNSSIQIVNSPPKLEASSLENAGVVYVLKTPMVIKIKEGGVDKFITFVSQFDKA